MPTDTIVLLAVVVGMFSFFAVVLYWGERQTRHLPPRTDEPVPEQTRKVA